MPNGEFEFQPVFNEFLPIVQGVTRVWIGDGNEGETGCLYAQYANGNIVNLGSVSLYALAQSVGDYQGTATQWVQDVARLASQQRGASISVTYQTSTDGTNPPNASSGWTSTPDPQAGKYVWSKYIITWYDGSTASPYYSVSYMGDDGGVTSVNGSTGAVVINGDNVKINSSSNQTIKTYIDNSIANIPAPPVSSVNTLTGNVVLYGSTIKIDDVADQTIKQYVDNLTPETATNAEIDAMFNIL